MHILYDSTPAERYDGRIVAPPSQPARPKMNDRICDVIKTNESNRIESICKLVLVR